jgi:hypothetical protein
MSPARRHATPVMPVNCPERAHCNVRRWRRSRCHQVASKILQSPVIVSIMLARTDHVTMSHLNTKLPSKMAGKFRSQVGSQIQLAPAALAAQLITRAPWPSAARMQNRAWQHQPTTYYTIVECMPYLCMTTSGPPAGYTAAKSPAMCAAKVTRATATSRRALMLLTTSAVLEQQPAQANQ